MQSFVIAHLCLVRAFAQVHEDLGYLDLFKDALDEDAVTVDHHSEPIHGIAVSSLGMLATASEDMSVALFEGKKLDAAHALVVSGQAAELADAIGNKIGCGAASRIFPPAGKHEADQAAFGLDMWYAVPCARETGDKFAMSDETLEKLKTFLASDDGHDGIQVLEPELEVHTTWTPNDPKMGQQPHYNTIKMKDAWEIEKGTPNVVVHVLDTGIDANHPDLKDMIWENPGEIPGDGIDNDNNGFVDDFHGYNFADMSGTNLLGSHWHGTHCGGTVAADSRRSQRSTVSAVEPTSWRVWMRNRQAWSKLMCVDETWRGRYLSGFSLQIRTCAKVAKITHMVSAE